MALWSLNVDGEADKLVQAIAKARHERDPDMFDDRGHAPNLVADAFALGLEELARKEGIDPAPFVALANRARRAVLNSG